MVNSLTEFISHRWQRCDITELYTQRLVYDIKKCMSVLAIAICSYNYVDLELEDQIFQVK